MACDVSPVAMFLHIEKKKKIPKYFRIFFLMPSLTSVFHTLTFQGEAVGEAGHAAAVRQRSDLGKPCAFFS